MTDVDWLSAIAKYRDEPTSPSKGGPRELGYKLTSETKGQPRRFARLICRLPLDTNPTYFKAVLRGLAEADRIESELVWSGVRHCEEVPGRPCGREISRLVSKYAGADLTTEILETVMWHATECPDPDRETWKEEGASGPYWGGDPETAGMNRCRGGTASALAAILFAQPTLISSVTPTLERMVADPNQAVRTQVADTLLPVLNVDRDLAVGLLLQLTEGVEDPVLGSRSIFRFLDYAVYTHFDELFPLIEQMRSSSDDRAQQHAARLFMLAALREIGGEGEVRCCLSGSEPMRKGLAEVAAAALRRAPNRTLCKDVLVTLFDDESADVRQQTGRWLYDLEGDELEEFTDLVEALIDSRAFQDHTLGLMQALEKTTARLPDVVCDIFERGLDLSEAEQPAGERFPRFDLDYHVTVLLRLYERSDSPSVRNRCLDIIDRLSRQTASRAESLLDRYSGRAI